MSSLTNDNIFTNLKKVSNNKDKLLQINEPEQKLCLNINNCEHGMNEKFLPKSTTSDNISFIDDQCTIAVDHVTNWIEQQAKETLRNVLF